MTGPQANTPSAAAKQRQAKGVCVIKKSTALQFLYIMELQTERLILWLWQVSDADALYKYAQSVNIGPRG